MWRDCLRGRKRNKVFQVIGLNDVASQEHMLQNPLILRSQEAVRIYALRFSMLDATGFYAPSMAR